MLDKVINFLVVVTISFSQAGQTIACELNYQAALTHALIPDRTPFTVQHRSEELVEYFVSGLGNACGYRIFGLEREEAIEKLLDILINTDPAHLTLPYQHVLQCIKNEICELDNDLFRQLYFTSLETHERIDFVDTSHVIEYLGYLQQSQSKLTTIVNYHDNQEVLPVDKSLGVMNALAYLANKNLYIYQKTDNNQLILTHRYVINGVQQCVRAL